MIIASKGYRKKKREKQCDKSTVEEPRNSPIRKAEAANECFVEEEDERSEGEREREEDGKVQK